MDTSFSFWKNLVFIIVFLAVTPVALGASLYSLVSLPKHEFALKMPVTGVKIFASLPSDTPTVSGVASTGDARSEIVRQYLERYNSPLASYADFIVTVADEFKIDFRLTTAIAQQESNLCKIIPPNTFNCWGWGIHSQGTLGFASYEEGIRTVTMGLSSNYINKGLITPEEIMGKYTPLSNGSWAHGVSQFLAEME
jgi:hypothetical protein